jgi:hypothetical protein
MPAYHEQFPVGAKVRVKPRQFLEQFKLEWQQHHPISDAQLAAADEEDKIKSVSFYHGGDVLYELYLNSGTWHEACLESLN